MPIYEDYDEVGCKTTLSDRGKEQWDDAYSEFKSNYMTMVYICFEKYSASHNKAKLDMFTLKKYESQVYPFVYIDGKLVPEDERYEIIWTVQRPKGNL